MYFWMLHGLILWKLSYLVSPKSGSCSSEPGCSKQDCRPNDVSDVFLLTTTVCPRSLVISRYKERTIRPVKSCHPDNYIKHSIIIMIGKWKRYILSSSAKIILGDKSEYVCTLVKRYSLENNFFYTVDLKKNALKKTKVWISLHTCFWVTILYKYHDTKLPTIMINLIRKKIMRKEQVFLHFCLIQFALKDCSPILFGESTEPSLAHEKVDSAFFIFSISVAATVDLNSMVSRIGLKWSISYSKTVQLDLSETPYRRP